MSKPTLFQNLHFSTAPKAAGNASTAQRCTVPNARARELAGFVHTARMLASDARTSVRDVLRQVCGRNKPRGMVLLNLHWQTNVVTSDACMLALYLHGCWHLGVASLHSGLLASATSCISALCLCLGAQVATCPANQTCPGLYQTKSVQRATFLKLRQAMKTTSRKWRVSNRLLVFAAK